MEPWLGLGGSEGAAEGAGCRCKKEKRQGNAEEGEDESGKSSVAQKTVDWLRNAVVYLTLRFPSLRIDFQALLPKPLRLLSITP